MFTILQTTPADSLNKVQTEIAAVAEKISNTPVDVLIGDLIDSAVSFGLKVLAAILIYIVGAWLIKKIKRMVGRIFEKKNSEPAIVSFTQSILSIALTILLVIITIGALGIDTTSLAALLAGGGMAIGMAMNGTVQNFAGGIMILVFKPFRSGDYIQVQGLEGTVSEVNIVSTKLTTVDNKCIIIPNGTLSNGTINNFSHNNIRRVDWNIDVEYGSDSELVKKTLMSLIDTDERVLRINSGAPANPFVALSKFNDSSIQFVMRAWVKTEDYWDVCFETNEKIYNELPEKGINFPYQKLDINIMNSNHNA